MYIVSYYLLNRGYGGPEEGGWWFDYGDVEPSLDRFARGFATEDAAYDYARRLNRHVSPKLNDGGHDINSVLCDGVYEAIVSEGYPKSFPEEIPHYC